MRDWLSLINLENEFEKKENTVIFWFYGGAAPRQQQGKQENRSTTQIIPLLYKCRTEGPDLLLRGSGICSHLQNLHKNQKG